MKRNLIVISLLVALLTSCNHMPQPKDKLSSTDSLVQQWTDAWNARDVEAISACFSNDAITITDTVYIGLEAIKAGFILKAAPIFANLTCQKINELTDEGMAYQSGSYQHDWIINDSASEKATGYYSIIWKKMEDESWRMILFHTN